MGPKKVLYAKQTLQQPLPSMSDGTIRQRRNWLDGLRAIKKHNQRESFRRPLRFGGKSKAPKIKTNLGNFQRFIFSVTFSSSKISVARGSIHQTVLIAFAMLEGMLYNSTSEQVFCASFTGQNLFLVYLQVCLTLRQKRKNKQGYHCREWQNSKCA